MGTQPSEAVIPPHSFAAEEAILGAVLLEGVPAMREAFPRLVPTDFYIDKHRTLYAALVRMWMQNDPIDLITIQEMLRRSGQLEAVTPASLALLVERGSIAAYLARYIDIVVVHSLWRQMIYVASQLMERSTGAKDDIRDTLDSATRQLQEIRERVI